MRLNQNIFIISFGAEIIKFINNGGGHNSFVSRREKELKK
jgi:hypothetical protein